MQTDTRTPVAAAMPRTGYRRPSVRAQRFTWAITAVLSGIALALAVGLGADTTAAGGWIALIWSILYGVPIAAVDTRHHLIPNWLVIGLGIGILVACLPHLSTAALAAAAVGGIYLVLNLTLGIGMGDVKLAAVCALAWGTLGMQTVLVGFAAGFAAAFPMALHSVLTRRRGTRIALGPWILLGSLITLTWSLLR